MTVTHRFVARATPSADGRSLRAMVVGWGDVGHPYDSITGEVSEVTVERGGLIPAADTLLAFGGHGDLFNTPPLLGTWTAADETDGLYAQVSLNDLDASRAIHHAASTGADIRVSMEFESDQGGKSFTLNAEHPATVTALAVLDRDLGAFPTAKVTHSASRKAPTMETETDDTKTDDDTKPDTDYAASVAQLREELSEEIRKSLAASVAAGKGEAKQPHPFSKYASFGALREECLKASPDSANEISARFAADYKIHTERQRARRYDAALVDQITADNPGLMQPVYLTEVFGILDFGRPLITATGGPRSPGEKGMHIYWPFLDPSIDLKTIVAEQLVQKTDVNSVKINFLQGDAILRTWAAASDIALQLLLESTPSYLGLHDEVLTASFNLVTDGAFAQSLLTQDSGFVTWNPATADPDGMLATVAAIDASLQVFAATGSPGDVIVAGTAAFAAFAKAFARYAPTYGTQNTGGTAQASTLHVEVSGITVVPSLMLPAASAVMVNQRAARWFERGPFLISALDVPKIGQDVAIWSLGEGAVFTPKGVVIMAAAAPTSDDTKTSKGK